jgi:hypothetical protein
MIRSRTPVIYRAENTSRLVEGGRFQEAFSKGQWRRPTASLALGGYILGALEPFEEANGVQAIQSRRCVAGKGTTYDGYPMHDSGLSKDQDVNSCQHTSNGY